MNNKILIIACTNSFILIQQLKRKLEFLKEQTKKDTDKNKNKQQRFRLEGAGDAVSGWVVTARDRENNSNIKWILVHLHHVTAPCVSAKKQPR
jgi:hypothetical protein